MQERPGPQVGVEEGGRAPDLGQAQPRQQEHGFVAQEKRNGVTLLHTGVFPEGSGDPIALSVRLLIGESFIFERNKRLMRVLAHRFQKTIQYCKVWFRLSAFPQAIPNLKDFNAIVHVLKKIRKSISKNYQYNKHDQPWKHFYELKPQTSVFVLGAYE